MGFWLKASAAVATVFVVAGALRLGLHQRRATRPLFGNARWATRQEVEKRPRDRSGLVFARRPPPDGLVLGKRRGLLGWEYVSLVGEEHAALTARSAPTLPAPCRPSRHGSHGRGSAAPDTGSRPPRC